MLHHSRDLIVPRTRHKKREARRLLRGSFLASFFRRRGDSGGEGEGEEDEDALAEQSVRRAAPRTPTPPQPPRAQPPPRSRVPCSSSVAS